MSKTRVVNIKFDQYDQYIGRAGKGQDGYFGNDHQIGFCYLCNEVHDRAGAINAFRKDFNLRLGFDPEYKRRVLDLKGKTLGCFCKQAGKEIACHGDVYVEYLDRE